MRFLNIKKNVVLSFVSAIAISLSSCNKFMDINETPNNPLEVPPSTLLPASLSGVAFANGNDLNRFASVIMSVTAGASGSPQTWDIYNTNGSDFGNQWRFEIYDGALINADKLITSAERVDGPAYRGIAKIIKAYTFGLTTDIWGDIPYSEALKGEDVLSPRLDSQRDIYLGNNDLAIQSLFDLVKEGLADLNIDGASVPSSDDIVYGGNIDNWKKAGNTLLLKLAMQISRIDPTKAKAIIDEVLLNGVYIKDNSENFAVKFGAQIGSQNPIWTYTNNSLFEDDQLISTRFLTKLQSLDDPRLPLFVSRPTGTYVTIDNGFRGTPPPAGNRSKFNNYVAGVNGEGPMRLLTNWQRAFILAEAVVRLGTAGDAQALFQEGIRSSMTAAGVSQEDVNSYFASHQDAVTLSGSDEQKIEKIINQKYISLFGNGLEQWNDWRRTGYPVLAQHQNAVGIDGTRPVRAVYVDQELQRNPNFPQGANLPKSNIKVWWDID